MSKLRLFADTASPVTRAVMLLLATNNVPYEFVHISLKDGEQHTNQELVSINPNHTVPAIEDNGFAMFESTAILKYICNKYNLPDHWYPKDVQKRARVDEAMSWFPQNLRCKAFYVACVLPRKTGQPTSEDVLKLTQTTLKKSVDIVESYFLKNRKFVAGDEISIADLLFFGEVTQYWRMGKNLCEGKSAMTQWIEDCKTFFGAHFDEIYKGVYKTIESKVFFTEMEYYK